MSSNKKNTAILLLHCQDQKGLIAALTDFIQNNDGHIRKLDEHVDSETQRFFMRVEWDLDGFVIPEEKIEEYFDTIVAKRFNMTWRIEYSTCIPRVALFVSRYSHCFFDILSRYESGEWKMEIPLIVSNHEKFRHVADRYEIPYYYFKTNKDTKGEVERQEYELMQEYKIDFIILARYMQILSEEFTSKFPNQIINIHHSSLPAFPGANPYKSAFERGVKILGATAHYVNQNLDDGPIISQDVIPISHNDSIAEMKRKGRDIEKIVLAKAIWYHMNHKIIPYNNKTVVFP